MKYKSGESGEEGRAYDCNIRGGSGGFDELLRTCCNKPAEYISGLDDRWKI